jgi:hypothetical protein
MELFALAIIVGISGGLAARLTPRKGWTMYTLTAALVTAGFIGLFSPIIALFWVIHIQQGEA